MNRLDYKDAPTGAMAIPTLEVNCDGCVYCAGNCANLSDKTSCFSFTRRDKTPVVFVPHASEHYARIALERVYESIEVSAALHKELIGDLAFLKYRNIQEQFGKEHMRMLNWIAVKYKLFGSQWHS